MPVSADAAIFPATPFIARAWRSKTTSSSGHSVTFIMCLSSLGNPIRRVGRQKRIEVEKTLVRRSIRGRSTILSNLTIGENAICRSRQRRNQGRTRRTPLWPKSRQFLRLSRGEKVRVWLIQRKFRFLDLGRHTRAGEDLLAVCYERAFQQCRPTSSVDPWLRSSSASLPIL